MLPGSTHNPAPHDQLDSNDTEPPTPVSILTTFFRRESGRRSRRLLGGSPAKGHKYAHPTASHGCCNGASCKIGLEASPSRLDLAVKPTGLTPRIICLQERTSSRVPSRFGHSKPCSSCAALFKLRRLSGDMFGHYLSVAVNKLTLGYGPLAAMVDSVGRSFVWPWVCLPPDQPILADCP